MVECLIKTKDHEVSTAQIRPLNETLVSLQSISTQDRMHAPCVKTLHQSAAGLNNRCNSDSLQVLFLNWIYACIDPLQTSVRVAVYIHECIIITIRDQVSLHTQII